MRAPQQESMVFEPSEQELLEEIERIRWSRAYWRNRCRSLQELLQDPDRARTLLICARQSLRARQRAPKRR